MNYIAVIHKEDKSDFGISFPDFPGCISAGKTLEEAVDNGKEALELHIAGMVEDGYDIPEPTSMDNIVLESEFKDSVKTLVLIESNFNKTIKYKRINISLPENTIKIADKNAEDDGFPSRSAYISHLIVDASLSAPR